MKIRVGLKFSVCKCIAALTIARKVQEYLLYIEFLLFFWHNRIMNLLNQNMQTAEIMKNIFHCISFSSIGGLSTSNSR